MDLKYKPESTVVVPKQFVLALTNDECTELMEDLYDGLHPRETLTKTSRQIIELLGERNVPGKVFQVRE